MSLNVQDAIMELKRKKPVIIFDLENENEGDLVYPSEILNETILTFMINNCKGIICSTISYENLKKLEIPVFSKKNKNLTGQTNFAFPIDHIDSETGISSKDRLLVIKELISDNPNKDNIVYPGHQNILKISENGLKSRQGHTESSSELVKLAGYKESATICEIIGNNGEPLRYNDMLDFCEKFDIKLVLLSEIYKYYLNKINIKPEINLSNSLDYINNKKVIITGGSSGIGKSISNKLKQLNCNVIDFSRKNNLDITNFDNIKDYIDKNISDVDILINCAGFIEPLSIEETSLETWNQHINVNITSVFYITKLLINKFNDNSSILNISSPSSNKTRNKWSAYCASKAALNSFTLNCSEEFKSKNIFVNALSPTKTDTPMIEKLFPDIDKNTLINPDIICDYVLNIINQSILNKKTGIIYEVFKNN